MIVEFILFGVSVAAVLVTVATIIYAQVTARREAGKEVRKDGLVQSRRRVALGTETNGYPSPPQVRGNRVVDGRGVLVR